MKDAVLPGANIHIAIGFTIFPLTLELAVFKCSNVFIAIRVCYLCDSIHPMLRQAPYKQYEQNSAQRLKQKQQTQVAK